MKSIKKKFDIIFVGSARDYHVLDWMRTVKKILIKKNISLVTDLIEGEGNKKMLINSDLIISVGTIDKYLFKHQSFLGNIWRNFVKLIFAINFAFCLKNLEKSNKGCIFHAHSMYYIFVCWLANIDFIATPQGSDILVRPKKSKIYSYFAKKSLQRALFITVDSIKLKNTIKQMIQRDCDLIQNGINTKEILNHKNKSITRNKVLSIRALAPNYNILELIKERNKHLISQNISFIYPFFEEQYLNLIKNELNDKDKLLGFMNKNELYNLFYSACAVVSIPTSDSSPRTVYEAIFSGCVVITTFEEWINILPKSMKERIILVELNSKHWLKKSLIKAKKISQKHFQPSKDAINRYDAHISMSNLCKKYYV